MRLRVGTRGGAGVPSVGGCWYYRSGAIIVVSKAVIAAHPMVCALSEPIDFCTLRKNAMQMPRHWDAARAAWYRRY